MFLFVTLWIFLAILAVAGAVLYVNYNGLVAMRQRCERAFADSDVQLKQRHDLIGNLVETVKGYAAHERETLEAVIAARRTSEAAKTPKDQLQAEGTLSAALSRLMIVVEAYPELKAQASFASLSEELTDTENRIANARRYLNNAAAEYNTAIGQFPAVLFAADWGFAARNFYDLGRESRKVAEVAPAVHF
jgi:LemA protein